jgi:CIC family chloride channel protein
VACGAAAGIASAYNAPIAGALFVSEIVFGSIAMQSLGPMIISSMAATLTIRYALGGGAIFEVSTFRQLSPAELGAYALLGLLAGLAGPWFLHALRWSERLFHALPAAPWLRMTLGGMAVGALSIAAPEVWGNGYSVVNSMLHHVWPWSAVLFVVTLKLAATAASVGSGAVGGVFTPTLFMGASLGSLVAIPLHRQWPEVIGSPQGYALVGMGCFLAATTHAPLMAILMVFEMTLDYEVVIPLTLGCVIAYFVAYGIEKDSIYSRTLSRKKSEPLLSEIKVKDLMKPEPWTVFENASFSDITAHFARAQQEFLFVVSSEGVFRGAIPLRSMGTWLNDPDLKPWAIAGDVVEADFPTVGPDTSMAELVERFAHHRGNRLAVVEPSDAGGARLVGSVSKTDLLLTIAHGVGSPSRGASEPGSIRDSLP